MHPNRYWIFFLVSVALVAIGFGGSAAWQLYRYRAYNATIQPTTLNWTVESKIGDRYYLVGEYSFEVEGKSFAGKTLLEKPLFRNLWSANQAIDEMGDSLRPVYFVSHKPEISTLNRHFPLKEVISAAALMALLLYFLCLGYYVAIKRR